MTRQEERELAHRIAAGDEAAAGQFDYMFRAQVEAFALKRGVPSSDCADVAQEVLADALRQLRQGRFREESTLGTWLHPIIRGGIANHFRKRRGPEVVSIQELAEDHRALAAASNVNDVVAVRQALSRLSSADQLLLLLYYRQGLTLEGIGPMVGVRKSAVWDGLKAARERFRAALRDGGKDSNPPRLKG